MGLIIPEEAQDLSIPNTDELIFHPDFSTKEKGSIFGCCGVVMDVIHTKIHKIRDLINLNSSVGKGSNVTIYLLISSSICQALLSLYKKECITFPMNILEEILYLHINRMQYNIGSAFS